MFRRFVPVSPWSRAAWPLCLAAGSAIMAACGARWTPPPQWTGRPVPAPATVVDLRVTDASLATQLAQAVAQAAALNERPFVELTSRLSVPCRWLDHSLGDPEMARVVGGTYVVRVDVDRWEGRLVGTGLDQHIGPLPAFAALASNGQPVGQWVDQRIWGSEAPRAAAPLLAALFHGGVFAAN
jgi:hypothetical protein